jgi:hypothetical protein
MARSHVAGCPSSRSLPLQNRPIFKVNAVLDSGHRKLSATKTSRLGFGDIHLLHSRLNTSSAILDWQWVTGNFIQASSDKRANGFGWAVH